MWLVPIRLSQIRGRGYQNTKVSTTLPPSLPTTTLRNYHSTAYVTVLCITGGPTYTNGAVLLHATLPDTATSKPCPKTTTSPSSFLRLVAKYGYRSRNQVAGEGERLEPRSSKFLRVVSPLLSQVYPLHKSKLA
jgi:hypothetical protein